MTARRRAPRCWKNSNRPKRSWGASRPAAPLRDGRAKKIYIARDADPRILQPLVQEAVRAGVRVEQAENMKLLGEACGIAVGAAIAAVV